MYSMSMCSIQIKFMRLPALIAVIAGLSACVTTPTSPKSPGEAAAPSPPGGPAFTIDDIEGKAAAEIDRLLGTAALARVEGQGEFRRYNFAQCGVLVVLYPNDKSVLTVTHVEATARDSDASTPDLAACLAGGF